ncbi:SpoIIE family protein phosphatase [Streptomyces sp. NPDC057638]|uniref:SpoIIE family protein phosphatase n=1 Tax=Streptomyces sp. NPDC057638 TaxID=3346190 RepID=UPI0036BE565A
MTTQVNGAAVFGAAGQRGEKDYYCDAYSVFRSAAGSVGAVVVDGVGDSEEIARDMDRLAWAMSRTTAQRGSSAGIMAGHHLLVDRGADGKGPSAVAVAADLRPGRPTGVSWAGDCAAFGANGKGGLTRYTDEQTVGEQLARNGGVPFEVSESHRNWVALGLPEASVWTVYRVEIPPEDTVILLSDGIVDQLSPGEMDALVRVNAERPPRFLAQALVDAARPSGRRRRDDATAVVLRPLM